MLRATRILGAIRARVNVPVFQRQLTVGRHAASPLSVMSSIRQANAAFAVSPRFFSTEHVKGQAETMSFQAETKQLLNIVAHSLYTDKEVFIRELVSNASDALEKMRYLQTSKSDLEVADKDQPMEIQIFGNETDRTITIQDFGVGMTKREMIDHLGTIAKSGSKAFLNNLKTSSSDAEAKNTALNIIGQFGVGFYSSFIVGSKVEVYSRSYVSDEPAHRWVSDGSGTFEIAEAEGVVRGTKIVIHLRDECKEFARKNSIEKIVHKYSNFVGFPIAVNGEKVNSVSAIWTKNPSSVSEADHAAFYRYISNDPSDPLLKLQYSTDSPINIRSVFYVPMMHMERFGLGRQESTVSLYSRKVLIQSKSKAILPEWLRFIRGVVDSEDIPLNISRETMQDSALIANIKNILTRRIVRWFADTAKRDPETFTKFYNEYSHFFKEGIVTDANAKDDLAHLLRWESSHEANKLISFDDYISRMPSDQQNIYYIVSSTRSVAESSPYVEAFRKKGREVLYLYNPIDEYVMQHLHTVSGKRLMTAEASMEDIGSDAHSGESTSVEGDLTSEQVAELSAYIKENLHDKVSDVVVSHRLVDSPAIVAGNGAGSMRKMMRSFDQGSLPPLPLMKMEINPKHTLIRNLFNLKHSDPALASTLIQQLFDTSLIAAGLLDDPRTMLKRLYDIMDAAAKQAK
eukprot:GILK01007124.1.p1 GENE.GILK01007124.1~~GILK01007124.1.p1  ORF type:complete len:686 (+),score=140.46 GILK01007124.1:58-2115(+)